MQRILLLVALMTGLFGGQVARAQVSGAAETPPVAAVPAAPAPPAALSCPTLSGQVIGDRSQPLVGATVVLGGTRVLFSTNSEGFFTLTVPNGVVNPRLEISAVGYEPQEFAVPNCDRLQVELRVLKGTKIKKKGKRKGIIQEFGREDGSKVKVKY